MADKKTRSIQDSIAHIERSIKKFGDADGSRTAELNRLRNQLPKTKGVGK